MFCSESVYIGFNLHVHTDFLKHEFHFLTVTPTRLLFYTMSSQQTGTTSSGAIPPLAPVSSSSLMSHSQSQLGGGNNQPSVTRKTLQDTIKEIEAQITVSVAAVAVAASFSILMGAHSLSHHHHLSPISWLCLLPSFALPITIRRLHASAELLR